MSTDWKKKYDKFRRDYELLEQWCNTVESNRHEAVLELQYEKGRSAGLEAALKIVTGREPPHLFKRDDGTPF